MPIKRRIDERTIWVLTGLLLVAWALVMALISGEFPYGGPAAGMPVLWLVVLMSAGGMVYLSVLWLIHRRPPAGVVVWIVLAGVAMRLPMMVSTPILEDDLYRYMWDGAVVARGMSPYAHSPLEVSSAAPGVPAALVELAGEPGVRRGVLERINHPRYRSIYPPAAEAVFAAAHLISPWKPLGLRVVLLAFDAATLAILALLMLRLRIPLCFLAVYWWNPLLIKEVLNSVHMDVMLLPFVLASVYLAARARPALSAVSLAIASAIKLWPVVLLPLVLRPLAGDARRGLITLGVFAALALVLFAPMVVGGLGPDSGLAAYGVKWENNSSLFRLVLWGSERVLEAMHIHPGHAQSVSRVVTALLFALYVGIVCRRVPEGLGDTARRALFIAAGLFLVIPTQFPWYFTWLLPLLALYPVRGLVLLTPLLPLYYMQYYLGPRGLGEYQGGLVVWIEFVPVWTLLLMDRVWPGAFRGRG